MKVKIDFGDNKIRVALVFAIFVSLVLASYGFAKTVGGEWKCIAQDCVEWATGDEWVEQNCKYLEGDHVCDFMYEGKPYRVPLKDINVSRMVSCKQYECSTRVLMKGGTLELNEIGA
jgi:hypothetical protein